MFIVYIVLAFCSQFVPITAQPPANPPPSGASPPASTSTVDPCFSGRCKPIGKSRECIVINKVWMYRGFNPQAYLPLDLSAYFKDRFDNYDDGTFPKDMNGSEMFLELFGNSVWSYWGRYYDKYSLKQAGCALPTQKFYLVWALIDIYEYYQLKNDECAVGPALEVCAPTLDQRSDSVTGDLKNKTLCNAPPEYLSVGYAYADRVKNHPFKSTSPTCADGLQVEADSGKCGYYTQYAACINQDTCPTMSSDLKTQCPAIIKQFNTIYNPNQSPSSSAWSNQAMINVIVPSLIGVGIGIAMAAGLVLLRRTRRKSSHEVKPPRPLSGHPEAPDDSSNIRDSVMSQSRNSMAPNDNRFSVSPFVPPFSNPSSSHRTSTIMYVDPDGNPVGGPIVIGATPVSPLVDAHFTPPFSSVKSLHRASTIVYVDPDGNPVSGPIVIGQPPSPLPEAGPLDGPSTFLMHHAPLSSSPLSMDPQSVVDSQYLMYVDENGVPVSTNLVPHDGILAAATTFPFESLPSSPSTVDPLPLSVVESKYVMDVDDNGMPSATSLAPNDSILSNLVTDSSDSHPTNNGPVPNQENLASLAVLNESHPPDVDGFPLSTGLVKDEGSLASPPALNERRASNVGRVAGSKELVNDNGNLASPPAPNEKRASNLGGVAELKEPVNDNGNLASPPALNEKRASNLGGAAESKEPVNDDGKLANPPVLNDKRASNVEGVSVSFNSTVPDHGKLAAISDSHQSTTDGKDAMANDNLMSNNKF